MATYLAPQQSTTPEEGESITERLALDEQSLRPDELSINTLTRELSLQKKPPQILRKLMNALEQKRQAKGLGWSRPWNKIGLNIFRSHVQNVHEDTDYFAPLAPFLVRHLIHAPQDYWRFVLDLLGDPHRMAFTFYHNKQLGDAQYEGLTLSLGRRVPEDTTKRDRLDVILEDLRVNGRVDGQVDRVRIYICPWQKYQNNQEHYVYENVLLAREDLGVTQELYHHCVRKYHLWKEVEERQWQHWSQRFIDYFGPRSFIPIGSSFS